MSCIHGEKGLTCGRCENYYSGKEYLASLKKIEDDKLNAKLADIFKDTDRLDWMIKTGAKVTKVLDDYWCEILGRSKMRSYSASTPRGAIDMAMSEDK